MIRSGHKVPRRRTSAGRRSSAAAAAAAAGCTHARASCVAAVCQRGAVGALALHRRQQRIHVLQAAAAPARPVVRRVRQERQLAQRAAAEAVGGARHLQQAPAAGRARVRDGGRRQRFAWLSLPPLRIRSDS